MEEIGAQVATPIFLRQSLSSRFCDPPAAMAKKKRDLPYQAPNYQHPNSQTLFGNPGSNSWNPNVWDWDAVRFVARPLDTEMMGASNSEPRRKEEAAGGAVKSTAVAVEDEDERLQLNLGGGLASVEEPAVSRPNKRVRSGSPGNNGGSYPMCQVDDCKEDLSTAKDYHRRHKVCESHSKSTKALVAKQMQRFCQQCSRFHPLSEFDEGKRSCRRRLAGHNRRRRKTQPEDVTSRLTIPGDGDNKTSGNLDIVSLLAAITRPQGKTDVRNTNSSSVLDREQLLQILSKINSLPLPVDLAAKLPNLGNLNWKASDLLPLDLQNKLNGKTSVSTLDLITVLSATLATPSDTLAILSQKSSQSSDSEKTKLTCSDQERPNLQKRSPQEFHSAGGERSSTSYQSPAEDSDCQVQETRVKLPLQLFSSSPEDDSPPKLASSRKYFSSDSSNRTEERSPSSSPPVMQTLFPMKSMAETVKSEKQSISKECNLNLDYSLNGGSNLPFDLFRGSNRGAVSSSIQNFPHQAGYTSSGSDHSPSSLNSDPQDRTGRILFKLFDKDPSQLPGTLRTQVYSWLSNSPSEMESHIRPGCVVLSVYVSMPFAAWEHLEENLVQHVSSLVQSSDSDFWRSGRFLVNTGRQLASHKDGKIRLCKAWRSYSSPELISVSPLAVVGGQQTSLSIRGRNLTNHGTKIHCTYKGGYTSKEVGTTYHGTAYDEINLGSFQILDASPGVLGRCFIEVENGFKGNSFPVIIADATICRELNLIESEFDSERKVCGAISEDENHDYGRPRSREEVLHFLNELGWLFQRKRISSMFQGSGYSLSRFKFLLTFSVERDFCTVVKTLLDILVNFDGDGLSRESLGMLSDVQLLNRAVKRRCRKMIDLLINYSVISSDKKYIFPPNHAGPGGLTPLHLAASMSNSEDMIDALMNDPEEIGLSCWNSLLDGNGQSPYAYAMMRNNYSYNNLVARKLTDKRNSQVTLTIGNEIEQTHMGIELERRRSIQLRQGSRSCAKCALAATKYTRRVPGAQGLLQRPFIHSMLAIAAVCVCVCLFLRGSPDIGSVAPFKWENLDFGTI
ncbi:PREDICTED: squamosa promoter-binding-like protein 14 [Fragaria vesca subsp. vesca]|uniref:squamosa promoter-binding-like protein 14 n=1 Tax=Fragaria vesca subsp. vesca TaxID=101020 RepID=UPI0002C3335E|nr:PREDICTED: squamosa promoter-binding-like protein 14 [Fragaria vesca subsp. vesca]